LVAVKLFMSSSSVEEGTGALAIAVEGLFFVRNIVVSLTLVVLLIASGWYILWKLYLSKYAWVRVLVGLNGDGDQSKRSRSKSTQQR